MESFQGQTFGDGVYRVHRLEEVDEWTSRIIQAFPSFKDQVIVFGYDWMGRQFAIDKTNKNEIIIFDTGFGEALAIPFTFEMFHEKEIPENSDECLLNAYFKEWNKNKQESLKFEECVGYKVPLFLGGEDDIENLEVIDMDVYWHIQSQFF